MKKSDKPSEHFVGAILRAYDKADRPVTCSKLWDYAVMECLGPWARKYIGLRDD